MIYVYDCPADGQFEIRKWKPEPAATEACPKCGRQSKRAYTPPRVVAGGGGCDDTVGHYADVSERRRIMLRMGIEEKHGVGHLVKVRRPLYDRKEEAELAETEGGES